MKMRFYTVLVVLSLCLFPAGAFADVTYGPHIDGLYKSFYLAPESGLGSFGTGSVFFDPTSQSADGYYDRIYWVNRVDDYESEGIYTASVYNGTSGGRLCMAGYASPYGITVDANGTLYVCYVEPQMVFRIGNPLSGSRVITQLLGNCEGEEDDDPGCLAMVPTGFGGGYAQGVDLILFDVGLDLNENEAIFVIYPGSTSTSQSYTVLYQDYFDYPSNNDMRGVASNFDGFAYYARMSIPSGDSGSGEKYFIERYKPSTGVQRIFLDVNGSAMDSNTLDDAIAVNPADGSVWMVIYYGPEDVNRAVYRVDVADANLISGSDYMATTTKEIDLTGADAYNIGVNGMAISPDGKLLALGCPSSRDKLYVYALEELDPPVNCADAIHKGYGLEYDFNSDCRVDFNDLKMIVGQWLDCIDPADANCSTPWQ